MNIAVTGLGRMGRWFAGELAGQHRVAAYDIAPQKLEKGDYAVKLNGLKDLRTFCPDLLLNAVNLRSTVDVFEKAADYLPDSCLLADIASIKGGIPAYYRESGRRYVSLHPMFGPGFTDMEQLSQENAIIISESDPGGKSFFREFFSRYDIEVFEYPFARHDELMSYSLTLPFTSSIVFSSCVTTRAVPGTTFARHREIASRLLDEDDMLLAEVLFNPYSLKQLDTICTRLEHLKHIIRARDDEEASKYLNRLRRNLGK